MRPILLGEHYELHHMLPSARSRMLAYDLDAGRSVQAVLDREMKLTPGSFRVVGTEPWGAYATPEGPVLFASTRRVALSEPSTTLELRIGDAMNGFVVRQAGVERLACNYSRTIWRWGNDVLEEDQEQEYDFFLWLVRSWKKPGFLTAPSAVDDRAVALLSGGTSSAEWWERHVRTIRAAPQDDAPRLVCADWLAERGDARGEFIALECHLARMPASHPSRATIKARRDELEQHQPWLRPLEMLGATAKWLWFSRGFVEYVELVGRSVANVGAICRQEPILEVKFASGGAGPYAVAAQAPELQGLRKVRFAGRHAAGVEVLMASPHLGGLRDFESMHCSPAIARALAGGAMQPEKVTLIGGSLDDVVTLTASGFFERAREIGLAPMGPKTAEALARAPLAALQVLDATEWKAASLSLLGPRLDRLQSLTVALDPGVAGVLREHVQSGRLRSLTVSGSTELAGLLESPVLAGVTELRLFQPLDETAAAALQRSAHRGALQTLRLPPRERFTLDGVNVVFESDDDGDEGW